MSASPSRFTSGQILGNRYRIVALLGRGGMGEVWQAYDLKLQVDVALKSIRPERFPGEQGLALLRREVRAAREVMSPNVCRIFDLVDEEGQEFVSMEYVDGETLLGVLRGRGPLELQEATRMASQFLAGLEAIHQAGLVHRDVKPENIMLTRTGRVVLMDFGVAKGIAEDHRGTIAGTPAYMAPEQSRGEALDARADIFAAGVVLAEMIAPEGVREHKSRESIWSSVRETPVRLFESPWRAALERAVASERAQRYGSAREFARALEEVTLRVEGAEDKRPYPGLESFTEADAEFFFGREVEVEAVLKKLQRANLLAIIGPSGAGKTSFVQAGLIPAKPAGWQHVLLRPGAAPFVALARALAPELAADKQAIDQLLQIEDPEQAVAVITRWRSKHTQALLLVDQFEELFTLGRPEIQAGFADLLGRLAAEADVHVLLVLRDDFLFHCHEHPRLAPISSDLTMLGPPTGSALRRALVQPALLSGYRFEDELLADEMLAGIEGERGALPMLAFAAARLWEHRDRDRGFLTRAAYEQIGGVSGALAQHAEAALERIGTERLPMVREVFRNLVTAHGTRAVQDVEELLSVFPDRATASAVVRELVNARLLTSFEVEPVREGIHGRRVEIVHESLLVKWPRLVRWQTQDADSAQFRDQLRQQARLWEERGRPADLLWTGSSYREFALWRERYPGGLTANEEQYAQAMAAEAERLRRRRQRILTATFASLAAIVAAVTILWVRAQRAERISEANRLNALARLEIDDNRNGALAYAIASLEWHDTRAARKFAMEVLATGAPALALEPNSGFQVPGGTEVCDCDDSQLAWSPDGHWLAQACSEEVVRVWSRDGGAPLVLRPTEAPSKIRGTVGFGPTSDVLVCLNAENELRTWSIPEGRLLRSVDLQPGVRTEFLDPYLLLSAPVAQKPDTWRWEAFSYATGEITPLGEHTFPSLAWWTIDAGGKWFVYSKDDDLYLTRAESLETAKPRFVGRHPGAVGARLNEARGLLASWDSKRPATCHVWSTAEASREPMCTVNEPMNDMPGSRAGMVFDAAGRFITSPSGSILDLDAPPGVLSAMFTPHWALGGAGIGPYWEAFHPQGTWLATSWDGGGSSIYPVTHSYARKIYSHGSGAAKVRFTPDGQNLLSTGMDGVMRSWSFERGPVEGSRVLATIEGEKRGMIGLTMSRDGRWASASSISGRSFAVSLDGGEPRWLTGFGSLAAAMAISDGGRYVAAAGGTMGAVYLKEAVIRVWDLTTGEVRVLDPGERKRIIGLVFLPDGRLLSGGQGGVRLWNIQDASSRLLRPDEVHADEVNPMRLLADGRSVLVPLVRPDRPEAVELVVWDTASGEWRHWAWGKWSFDAAGTLYTGQVNGVLYIGRTRRRDPPGQAPVHEEPHAVIRVTSVLSGDFSPDGKLAAVGSQDGSVWILPVPEGPALQTLPRREFMARLRATTNVRAVPDGRGSYRLEARTFPGWKTVPEW